MSNLLDLRILTGDGATIIGYARQLRFLIKELNMIFFMGRYFHELSNEPKNVKNRVPSQKL